MGTNKYEYSYTKNQRIEEQILVENYNLCRVVVYVFYSVRIILQKKDSI